MFFHLLALYNFSLWASRHDFCLWKMTLYFGHCIQDNHAVCNSPSFSNYLGIIFAICYPFRCSSSQWAELDSLFQIWRKKTLPTSRRIATASGTYPEIIVKVYNFQPEPVIMGPWFTAIGCSDLYSRSCCLF